MAGGNIITIELAVGAATFVLGARLFALIQATRNVPAAHAQVLEGLASGDLKKLETKARGLGYSTPYGDLASDVIFASQREAASAEERRQFVSRASKVAKRRVVRRTQQSQAMDLTALIVAVGIIVFARDALPTGPLFWSLAGAVLILLPGTVLGREQLKASIVASLDSLETSLVARPAMPSISDGPLDCFWCGGKMLLSSYVVRARDSEVSEEVNGALCVECGKFVTTLSSDDEPVSD